MLLFLVSVLPVYFLFSDFFLCYFRKDLIWDLDDNSTIEDLVVQISEKVLKRFVIYCLVAEKVVESDYLMAFSVFIMELGQVKSKESNIFIFL